MEQVMRVEGFMSRKKPERTILAVHWAEKVRAAVDQSGCFRDPELEREYQAWKKAREERQ